MKTFAPRRQAFDDSRDERDAPVDDRSGPPRFACAAMNCPMPGTMYPSGGRGICAWHYGTNTDDWSRITEVFRGPWRAVARELLETRRVLCDPDLCTSARALAEFYRVGAERLRLAHGPTELAPREGEAFAQWALRLETFLGGCVMDVVRKRVGSAR